MHGLNFIYNHTLMKDLYSNVIPERGYFTCALMMYVQIKQAELLVFEFFQLMVMVNLASLVFCATNIPFKHIQ